jgi:hypothetical protein
VEFIYTSVSGTDTLSFVTGIRSQTAQGSDRRGARCLDCGRARLRKRFIVHAEEILTAFLEVERAIHQFVVTLICMTVA